MNNQLTERILAQYVGTGVRIQYNDSERTYILNSHEMSLLRHSDLGSEYKIILRPPFDLIKPCLEGGKVPIEVIFEMLHPNINREHAPYLCYHLDTWATCTHSNTILTLFIDFKKIEDLPYKVVNYLHENHFDTKNLIGTKKAIDINTMEVK